MSNFSDWPTCAECTNRRRATHPGEEWCPVEEYGLDVATNHFVLLSGRYSARIVVQAACSHGRGFTAGTIHRQDSEPIDCPHWWNVDTKDPLSSHYLRTAVRSLRFFESDRRPQHRMVTLVT